MFVCITTIAPAPHAVEVAARMDISMVAPATQTAGNSRDTSPHSFVSALDFLICPLTIRCLQLFSIWEISGLI